MMQAKMWDISRSLRIALSFIIALALVVGLAVPAAAGGLGAALPVNVQQAPIASPEVGETPFQQSVQAALAERTAQGLPMPKVSFVYSVDLPGATMARAAAGGQPIRVMGKTILEFGSPAEAGYARWPSFVVEGDLPGGARGAAAADNYDQLIRDAVAALHPGAWEQYEFGHEPRTYVVEETLVLLVPPDPAQAPQATAAASDQGAHVDQVVMGFTVSGPDLDYSITGAWQILGLTVAEARAGFVLGWGAGLRLPLQATLIVPSAMEEGQDYTATTSLARLDWSAADYAAAGLAPEDGSEFVLHYALVVGAWAKILGAPVVDWKLSDVRFDSSRSFRTPFGTGDTFAIPELDLSPGDTGLQWNLSSVLSLGIGFVVEPDIVGEKITANWQAGSHAAVLTYTVPDTAVEFGPIHEPDFGQGDSVTVQISGFRYWFTQFLLKLGGYLQFELFGYGTKSGNFSIAEVDVHDITGDLYLDVHPGTDGTVAAVGNRSPICATAAPTIERLWPADNQFVEVGVLGVTDRDADPVAITISSIAQDEPVDDPSWDFYGPDGYGIGTSTASLRAQSDPAGNGRIYHVAFAASDAHGGSCVDTVHVGVPKSDAGETPPVDDGALYDTTAASVKPLFITFVRR